MKTRLGLLLPAFLLLAPKVGSAANTLTGTVTDCGGEPLKGVLVYIAAQPITGNCSNWQTTRVSCRVTDAGGHYSRSFDPDPFAIHWCVVVVPDGIGDGYGGCAGLPIMCCNDAEPQTSIASVNSPAGVDNHTFTANVQMLYTGTCVTGVGDLVGSFHLGPFSPNPFRISTTAKLHLSRPGPVNAVVFDAQGRRVRRLLRAHQPAGELAIVWDGRDDRGALQSPGVYSLRVNAEGRVLRRTTALVR
jgi:hypothetical protein